MIDRRALIGAGLILPVAAGAQSFRVGRAPGFRSGLRFLSQAAATTFTTLNPADKGSAVTLSGGNLTATSASASDSVTRSVAGKTSGSWYFEWSYNGTGACGVGLATGALSNASYPGSSADSIGYYNAGSVQSNAATAASYASYSSGNTGRCAFKGSGGTWKVWFGVDGTWQSGSPAAGTGGLSLTASQLFAALDVVNGAALVMNFGASPFVQPIPTGFTGFTTGST